MRHMLNIVPNPSINGSYDLWVNNQEGDIYIDRTATWMQIIARVTDLYPNEPAATYYDLEKNMGWGGCSFTCVT